MLEHESYIDVKEFKSNFDKKFSNFCKKAPIFLSYVASDTGVTVYRHSNPRDRNIREKIIEFDFDFSKSVKENIFEIRKILVENWYPTLTKIITYEEPHNVHELNMMVGRGEITINDIGTNGILKQKEVVLRIERVIVMKDWLFIRNLDTLEMSQYRTKIPVTIFLRKVQELDNDAALELFNQKALFTKIVEEDEGTKQLLLESKGGVNATV